MAQDSIRGAGLPCSWSMPSFFIIFPFASVRLTLTSASSRSITILLIALAILHFQWIDAFKLETYRHPGEGDLGNGAPAAAIPSLNDVSKDDPRAQHLTMIDKVTRTDSADSVQFYAERSPDAAEQGSSKSKRQQTKKKKHASSVDELEAQMIQFGGGNPSRTPDGLPIVQGDIVIADDAIANQLKIRRLNSTGSEEGHLSGYKAVPETALLWRHSTIPYSFHSSVNEIEKQVILEAMDHWMQTTCIKFHPRRMTDFFYIQFRSDQQGCWSLVGRQFFRFGRGQDISIGKGCATRNTVAHEIGHAVGFFHEQSRYDRDQAIQIIWENVEPGLELQFRKEFDEAKGVPYDYTSVMQYPSWAFSTSVLERNTIVTNEPQYQRLLGKNKGLSFRDRKLANSLYSCNDGCPNRASNQCQNGGYLKPYRGDGLPCECDCPPNYAGRNCETKIRDDYYDPLPCGGNMTTEGVLQTPDYPSRSQPNMSCAWIIQAPPGQVVQLTFDGFEVAPRYNKTEKQRAYGKCYEESVEIRMEDPYYGTMYCGDEISPGTVMRSKGRYAIIIIQADDKMRGKGLKANVRFINAPSSTPTTRQPFVLNPWRTRAPFRPDWAGL